MAEQTITIKLRIKDKHASELRRCARAVNYVWNYCNATQRKAASDRRQWLSGFDLVKLTSGSSNLLGLHSKTISQICLVYASSRAAKKRHWLQWRSAKSLGWVPFHNASVTCGPDGVRFMGRLFETMHFREELIGALIGCGSFSSDARGRWYINFPIRIECSATPSASQVGIDLGLKELATLSTGEKIEAPRLFRGSEARVAAAQRARKSKRVRAIHAKIADRRKDFLHKASAQIAKGHGFIVIGDVSPKQIARTRLAKSSLDAGWSDFKRMLSYKSIRNGGSAIEVSERYTSRTCSCCGAIPQSSPKGIGALGIREWTCDDCGSVHDRDVNAAKNILRLGLETLVAGAAKKRSGPKLLSTGQVNTPA